MTQKILSLEEIEKWQDIAEKYKYYELFDHINEDGLKALLATARAYHELKKSSEDKKNETKIMCYPGCKVCEPDGKPHAPTIKAVIGALSEGTDVILDGAFTKHIFNPKKTIKSLESILKEL